MPSENVYVLRRATFDFVFFPETRMLELLFKKRIKSKVVLRKAVGFFEKSKRYIRMLLRNYIFTSRDMSTYFFSIQSRVFKKVIVLRNIRTRKKTFRINISYL